jgi:hypothetical protein
MSKHLCHQTPDRRDSTSYNRQFLGLRDVGYNDVAWIELCWILGASNSGYEEFPDVSEEDIAYIFRFEY